MEVRPVLEITATHGKAIKHDRRMKPERLACVQHQLHIARVAFCHWST